MAGLTEECKEPKAYEKQRLIEGISSFENLQALLLENRLTIWRHGTEHPLEAYYQQGNAYHDGLCCYNKISSVKDRIHKSFNARKNQTCPPGDQRPGKAKGRV
jgi:hypothetical protein